MGPHVPYPQVQLLRALSLREPTRYHRLNHGYPRHFPLTHYHRLLCHCSSCGAKQDISAFLKEDISALVKEDIFAWG